MNYKKLSKVCDSSEKVFIYGSPGGGFPSQEECTSLLSPAAFNEVEKAYYVKFEEEAEEVYPDEGVDAGFMYSETEADAATGFVSNVDPDLAEDTLEGVLYWSVPVSTEEGTFYVGLSGV